MDYLLPTACDIPRIEIEHPQTVPLDANVSFRGVGEGRMIVAPPTVLNAIEDALAPSACASTSSTTCPGPHSGAHRPARRR